MTTTGERGLDSVFACFVFDIGKVNEKRPREGVRQKYAGEYNRLCTY
jgi:hypothetical protein